MGSRSQGYLKLETDAAVVYDYHLAYVPGLLQTADYARAVFRGYSLPRTEAELTGRCRSGCLGSAG